MKGKNWREYEPPKKAKKRRRRRKGGLLPRLIFPVLLFVLGYLGFQYYYFHSKPYTVALDAGHGGVDIGAEGLLNEVLLTESTVEKLEKLLEEDGRFRVVLSRKEGEGKSITERNQKFQRIKPDLVLSIHGNANDDPRAYGFECYPSPPGYENNGESMIFAGLLAEEMEKAGARLRGGNGVRFGYYISGEGNEDSKMLVDSTDTTVYDYDTFGMVKNMTCPAVLVEQCFITNEEDVAAFASEEGCQKAAQAYYQAICGYLIKETTV